MVDNMNLISKIKTLLKMLQTKKALIEEFTQIQKNLDNKTYDIMKHLEELDQNKVYAVCDPNLTKEDIEAIQDALKQVSRDMKWTPPKIIFMNQDIMGISTENLEAILEKMKEMDKNTETTMKKFTQSEFFKGLNEYMTHQTGPSMVLKKGE